MSGLTADELVTLVQKAHAAHDQEGVQSALVALAVLDPARAAQLLDAMDISLDLDLGARAEGES